MGATGTIVMAVYRPDPVLLERQVRSLQAQTFPHWTCVIGLDGPDGAVRRRIEDLVDDDARFTVVEHDVNMGHYRHFERLLAAVPEDAAWFALCDQDDEWYAEKLEVLVTLLGESGAAAVMGQADVTDPDGHRSGRTSRAVDGLAPLLLKNQVTGCFLVARRSLLTHALPFPDATSSARHDHWLGVVAEAAGGVVVTSSVLQAYVQHAGNAIGEVDPVRTRHRPRARTMLRSLDRLATEVWGWRVTVARALRERGLDTGPEVRAVANGALGPGLARTLLTGAARRQLRPEVLAGSAIAAAWWPVAGRRSRVRHRGHAGRA